MKSATSHAWAPMQFPMVFLFYLLAMGLVLAGPASATRVYFSNCLASKQTISNTTFKPTDAQAFYKPRSNGTYLLEMQVQGHLNGVVEDMDATTNTFTTLLSTTSVMGYTINNFAGRFCEYTVSGCPLNGTAEFDYSIQINQGAAYQGMAFATNFVVIDPKGAAVACIDLEMSPVLKPYTWYIIVFSVVAIVMLCAVSGWVNMIYRVRRQAWGLSSTSAKVDTIGNFGAAHYSRQAMLLFSNIFQYLQFQFLCACLTLAYPGFYQPVLSSLSWTCLLFHFSFVSNTDPTLNDGLYPSGPSPGMVRMARVVQLSHGSDVWPSFIVWLICVTVIVLIITFGVSFLYHMRQYHQSRMEVLKRTRDVCLSVFERLMCEIFGFPLLALSFFQMTLIGRGSSSVVSDVFALIVILAWFSHALWKTIVWYKKSKQEKCSATETYMTAERCVLFCQSLAVGAVQRSSTAQIAMLAIFEVCRIGLVAYYKPSASSKSAMRSLAMIILSSVKGATVLLLIAFLRTLGVSEPARGWLGYVLLIIDGIVLLIFAGVALEQIIMCFKRRHYKATSDDSELSKLEHLNTANSYQRKVVARPAPLALASDTLPLMSKIDTNLSALGSPASPTTPTEFYRRPKRQSTSDWHGSSPFEEDGDIPRPQTSMSEMSNKRPSSLYSHTDYATREADIYITKAEPTSYEAARYSMGRLSEHQVVHDWDNRKQAEMETVPNNGRFGLVSNMFSGIKRVAKNIINSDSQERGEFQVVNRQPIRPSTDVARIVPHQQTIDEDDEKSIELEMRKSTQSSDHNNNNNNNNNGEHAHDGKLIDEEFDLSQHRFHE